MKSLELERLPSRKNKKASGYERKKPRSGAPRPEPVTPSRPLGALPVSCFGFVASWFVLVLILELRLPVLPLVLLLLLGSLLRLLLLLSVRLLLLLLEEEVEVVVELPTQVVYLQQLQSVTQILHLQKVMDHSLPLLWILVQQVVE